jgi:hypothetical protein
MGLSAGCARLRPTHPGPPPADRAWPPTLSLARTLRRIAGELDRLNRLAGNALAQQIRDVNASPSTTVGSNETRPDAPKPSPDATAQDEIKRLKDELAKANAELERIRRRLAQPPGKP